MSKMPASTNDMPRYRYSKVLSQWYCSFDDWVLLVYYLPSLPLKPWPRKVAGVPCFLTTNPNNQGSVIPIERPSRSRIMVSSDLNFRDNEDAKDELYKLIREFFEQSSISITEIQYWGSVVVIVLECDDESVLSAVPRFVARCPCFYLFERPPP
jgi:hypothetical protein